MGVSRLISGRSKRTDEQQHIAQNAMNWSPKQFELCADGKYRNALGQEAVLLSEDDIKNIIDKEADND